MAKQDNRDHCYLSTVRHAIKARGHVTKYWRFRGYNSIYYEVIAYQTFLIYMQNRSSTLLYLI
jgi:hypothetical protein